MTGSFCAAQCASVADHHNTVDLDHIGLSRESLSNMVADAESFRTAFLERTQLCENGLTLSGDRPDWAAKILRRHSIVDAVVDKIGSNLFAKRKPQDKQSFREYVSRCHDAQNPIVFRVPVGPLKNIRCSGSRQSPDLAEYLSYIQLSRVMEAVASLYPHGVRVQLVPDDMRAMTANKCTECYVHCYIAGLKEMVRDLGYEGWLTVTDGQRALYETYKTQEYWNQAEQSILDWKNNDAESFSKRWVAACENAEKNFNIERGMPSVEAVETAAWRYLVAHQSEILSGMWSTRDVFPLVYANHAGNYQMFTLASKHTKLPWQITLPFETVAMDRQALAA